MTTVDIRFVVASPNEWPNSCTGLETSVYVDGVKQAITFSKVPFNGHILQGTLTANSGQVISASLFDARLHTHINGDRLIACGIFLPDSGQWADPNEPTTDGVYVTDRYRWVHKSVKLS